MMCLTNINIYNFFIFTALFFFSLDNLQNGLNDPEQEMTNIDPFDNSDDIGEPYEHDEYDESNVNIADYESENGDESSEIFDSNDEKQLLFDYNDEEFVDNWTTDVIESDLDIVHEQSMILSLLRKCRGLTSMIKRSTIMTLYFDAERRRLKKKRNLCYDVKSRWNSTYCMINSFIVLREPIQNLFSHKHQLKITSQQVKKLSEYELTSDNWNVLLVLHSVLQPFYFATQAMSGRQYPSIGLAYYLIIRLKNFLQRHDKKVLLEKRLKQLLMNQFLSYFRNEDEQMEILKVSNYDLYCC